MPKIMIKGGVWRNTEDEILKAAVMKYGKNQWSRIASLLHRKSAKQCKARWYEWLDPSIKKTEWSREEDEKLLHLAKILPTQWRTISSMVGRTTAQCLERYEFLLDQAQRKEDGTAGDSFDDPRKLRPGEIDPNPETKPARPDPKDMDEDELEMLSEARARLANTQGKKAKRKAREKQLEEARRLAALQKRRELTAAGIDVRLNRYKRKAGVDYNAEIPFEMRPLPGFHDTSEELAQKEKLDFKNLKQQDLEGELRSEKEEKERAKDKQKVKKMEAVFEEAEPLRKRSKLVLPEPQVSDNELQSLVKLSRVGELAKEAVTNSSEAAAADATASGASESTEMLLSNYSVLEERQIAQSQMRTPAAPVDRVMEEARNIIALAHVDTPLAGGVNTTLSDVDFAGAAPKSIPIQTPNQLLMSAVGQTPESSSCQSTPGSVASRSSVANVTASIRDQLSLNTTTDGTKSGAVTPSSTRSNASTVREQKLKRREFIEHMQSLPTPRNDYELVVNMELTEDDTEKPSEPLPERDQSDIDAKLLEERIQREKDEFALKSKVLQRNLLRPYEINFNILRPEAEYAQLNDLQKADEMIKTEMLTILCQESLEFPIFNPLKCHRSAHESQTIRSQVKTFLDKHPYRRYEKPELEEAQRLLEAEMDTMRKSAGGGPSFEAYEKIWRECLDEIQYLPSENRFTRLSLTGKKDRLEAAQREFDRNRSYMTQEAKRATKLEKKLRILTFGYSQKAQAAAKRIADLHEQIDDARLKLDTFRFLEEQEHLALPRRIEMLEADIRRQIDTENELRAQLANGTMTNGSNHT